MSKKKRFSPLKFLLVVLCLVSIIVSVVLNIAFTQKEAPKFYDRYLYIVPESNPLEGDITTGAALIAKDASDISIAAGDIVLCYPADTPNKICLRSINAILQNEDGTESYYTKDSNHEDTVDSISKEKILAVCTGYPESLELGKFVTFTLDTKGILAELVAPCVILIILLIANIFSSRKDEEEEENDFYEYEEAPKSNDSPRPQQQKPSAPLYEHTPESYPTSNDTDSRIQSIAENFSQKKVDPNSPYQKEKERTMQFKAQRESTGNTGRVTTGNTGRINNSQSSAYTPAPNESLKQEILRKTETNGSMETKTVSTNAALISSFSDDDPEITGVLSKSQVEELSKETAPRPAPKTAPQPRKSSTPDISDILSKTETEKKKKNTSNLSVDDLLKMIEDEKNRL